MFEQRLCFCGIVSAECAGESGEGLIYLATPSAGTRSSTWLRRRPGSRSYGYCFRDGTPRFLRTPPSRPAAPIPKARVAGRVVDTVLWPWLDLADLLGRNSVSDRGGTHDERLNSYPEKADKAISQELSAEALASEVQCLWLHGSEF